MSKWILLKNNILKQLFLLLFLCLTYIQSNAQDILDTDFSYSNVGENYTFYLSSYFSFGSGGTCPKVKWVLTETSNDTVFIKPFYDHRGHWPMLGCGSNDTIKYLNTNSGINFFNLSTNYITEFGMDPTEVDTFRNVYDTTFNLNASRINKHNLVNNILIYPNPNDGNITILESGKASNQLQAVVIDMLGRVISQQQITFLNNQSNIKIDAPQGNYIIELKDKSGTTYRQRILIQ